VETNRRGHNAESEKGGAQATRYFPNSGVADARQDSTWVVALDVTI
jgi:hypothetical protein